MTYEIVNLVKRYCGTATAANDGISLTVRQGEVFGMLGPNGAGKTTLVRQMAGLIKPTSGELRLFGHDLIAEPWRAPDWVAMQLQGATLPRFETPRSLIARTGELRGLSETAARREAEALLAEFRLPAHAGKRMHLLSGGLHRLVAIATALVGRRPVLIFDEPTNDLDPEIRRVVWERIRTCARDGATVILVTHNVVEAEQALDRVAIIRAGRVLAMGTPADLKGLVAKNVRLELALRPGADPGPVLAGWPAVQPLGAHRFAVTVPREAAQGAMVRLTGHLDQVEDFRVVTPNLEDVYIELSGGERLAG